MEKDVQIVIRVPREFRERLKKIAKAQQLPSYNYLVKRDLSEKYPELINKGEK